MLKKTYSIIIIVLFALIPLKEAGAEPEPSNNIAPKEAHILYRRDIEQEKIGLIESVNGQEIVINLGRNVYVTPSMEFKVFRKEQRIEMPATGIAQGVKEYYVGKIKVIETEDTRADCKIVHTEPTDKLMVNDKVINVPGTGYEELIKKREADNKAKQILLQAKAASRHDKALAIELYDKITAEFSASIYSKVAQKETDRYSRIQENSPYSFKGSRSLNPPKSASSSLSKDIAVDGKGNIWLLNSKKSSVEKYNSQGKLQLTIEKKNKYGREIMQTPKRITIDHTNNLYVLDTGLNKVSKFNSKGKFLKAYGPKDGQKDLDKPVDLAVNSNQDVFILDGGSCRIHAFTEDNDFWAIFGQLDASQVQDADPIAIDIDEDDNIYVLDQGTKYMHIFTKDLRLKKKVKLSKISEPVDMAVLLGRIFVLDADKCSAIQYDATSFKIKNRFGASGRAAGKFSDPTGIAVDNQTNIYISDGKNYNIQKFSQQGKFLGKLKDEQVSKSVSLAVNDSDNIYILDNRKKAYQEFDRYGWSLQFVPLKGRSQNPKEIAIDYEGNVYVLDSKTYQVQKFSSQGKFLSSFGSKKIFKAPVDICIDREGNIYILDSRDYAVKKFDPEGSHLKSFGEKLHRKRKETFGHFKKPVKIAVSSEGTVYVLDERNKAVYKFNAKTGDFIDSFQKPDKKFGKPVDIAVDGLGYIYVADAKDKNIYKFKNDGTLVNKIALPKSKDIKFKNIASLSVNGAGSIFVLDSSKNQILEFRQ